MSGYLLDENLPASVPLPTSRPLHHATDPGRGVAAAVLWEHARRHVLVIVTEDADASDRALASDPPPRVIQLWFGNLSLKVFERT